MAIRWQYPAVTSPPPGALGGQEQVTSDKWDVRRPGPVFPARAHPAFAGWNSLPEEPVARLRSWAFSPAPLFPTPPGRPGGSFFYVRHEEAPAAPLDSWRPRHEFPTFPGTFRPPPSFFSPPRQNEFSVTFDADGTIGGTIFDSDTDFVYFDDCNDAPDGSSADHVWADMGEGVAWFRLSDVPAAFVSAVSATVRVDGRALSIPGGDTSSVTVRIFAADNDTSAPLTNESPPLLTEADSARTQRSVALTGVTGSKAQWDGAYARVTWTYSGTPSGGQLVLYGFLLSGVYSDAPQAALDWWRPPPQRPPDVPEVPRPFFAFVAEPSTLAEPAAVAVSSWFRPASSPQFPRPPVLPGASVRPTEPSLTEEPPPAWDAPRVGPTFPPPPAAAAPAFFFVSPQAGAPAAPELSWFSPPSSPLFPEPPALAGLSVRPVEPSLTAAPPDASWWAPASEPVRLPPSLAPAHVPSSFYVGVPALFPTDPSLLGWHRQTSEPVRVPGARHPSQEPPCGAFVAGRADPPTDPSDALQWFFFPPGPVFVLPPHHPSRMGGGLPGAEVLAGPFVPPSQWAPPPSQPLREGGSLHPAVAGASLLPPPSSSSEKFVIGWQRPASEPVLPPPSVHASLVPAFSLKEEPSDLLEPGEVYVSMWWRPASEPALPPPALHPASPGASVVVREPTLTTAPPALAWYAPASEPVREPARSHPALPGLSVGTLERTLYTPPPDRAWFSPPSEPVREPERVHASGVPHGAAKPGDPAGFANNKVVGEFATGTDSVAYGPRADESPVGLDVARRVIPLSDAGSGSDFVTLVPVAPEYPVGSVSVVLAAAVSVAESAVGSDAGSPRRGASVADSASASDSASPGRLASLADSASASDSSPSSSRGGRDSASASSSATVYALVGAAESASASASAAAASSPSVSDSAAASDAPGASPVQRVQDEGLMQDALSARITTHGEHASASESRGVIHLLSDSGSGGEDVLMANVGDSGSASEAVSVIHAVTESGASATSATVEGPSAVAEAGSASESASASFSPPLSDAAAASDAASAAPLASAAESTAAAEAVGVEAAGPPAESGRGAEAASVGVLLQASDSASGRDFAIGLPCALTRDAGRLPSGEGGDMPANIPPVKLSFRKGDLLVVPTAAVVDGDGARVNIDPALGYTAAFRMVEFYGGTVKIDDAAAVITEDPADEDTWGDVRYDWQAADVDAAGLYRAWFVVYKDGKEAAYPATPSDFLIHIWEE